MSKAVEIRSIGEAVKLYPPGGRGFPVLVRVEDVLEGGRVALAFESVGELPVRVEGEGMGGEDSPAPEGEEDVELDASELRW